MRRECRERFPHHRLQRKLVVSDPGMHHGACVTHVPWCMSWSLTRGGEENFPGIPGACATRNIAYLVRGPWGPKELNSPQPTCDSYDASKQTNPRLVTNSMLGIMFHQGLVPFCHQSNRNEPSWSIYSPFITSLLAMWLVLRLITCVFLADWLTLSRTVKLNQDHFDSLVQTCSIINALAIEILQTYTKLSV